MEARRDSPRRATKMAPKCSVPGPLARVKTRIVAFLTRQEGWQGAKKGVKTERGDSDQWPGARAELGRRKARRLVTTRRSSSKSDHRPPTTLRPCDNRVGGERFCVAGATRRGARGAL